MSVVIYELENHVALITLNRPEALNTFNPAMYSEFNAATERFRQDKDAWVAVIAGAGDKAFSAGLDIKTLDNAFNESGGNLDSVNEVFDVELQGEYFSDKPIIAAIQGFCIGEGLSTALACDLRIATESAIFALPESKIGVPTINASIHGARIMGTANALELLLMGEQRDAKWAYRTGLVNLVVAEDELLDIALDWARKIAGVAPLANRVTKEAVVRSQYRTFTEVVEIARHRREEMANGPDGLEGRRAFIEKRKPRFIGE